MLSRPLGSAHGAACTARQSRTVGCCAWGLHSTQPIVIMRSRSSSLFNTPSRAARGSIAIFLKVLIHCPTSTMATTAIFGLHRPSNRFRLGALLFFPASLSVQSRAVLASVGPVRQEHTCLHPCSPCLPLARSLSSRGATDGNAHCSCGELRAPSFARAASLGRADRSPLSRPMVPRF